MTDNQSHQVSTNPIGNTTEVCFESHGTRLYAFERGSGPPLIFMHGLLADHRAALPVVAPWVPPLRAITPDLRGNGQSVYPAELTWDIFADDLLALLDHLGLERVVVGGVSSGSGVALRFVLRYPKRAAGAVLVTPVYAGADLGLTAAQTQAFRFMDAHGCRAPKEGVQVLRPLFQHLPEPIREQALAMIDGFDAASVATTTSFIASGVQPFSGVDELASVTTPVLLLPGADDLHPTEVATRYTEHIPSCTVVALDASDPARVVTDYCTRVSTQ